MVARTRRGAVSKGAKTKFKIKVLSKICALSVGALRWLICILPAKFPAHRGAVPPRLSKPNKIQPKGSVLGLIFFKQRFLHGTHRQLYQAGQRS